MADTRRIIAESRQTQPLSEEDDKDPSTGGLLCLESRCIVTKTSSVVDQIRSYLVCFHHVGDCCVSLTLL